MWPLRANLASCLPCRPKLVPSRKVPLVYECAGLGVVALEDAAKVRPFLQTLI